MEADADAGSIVDSEDTCWPGEEQRLGSGVLPEPASSGQPEPELGPEGVAAGVRRRDSGCDGVLQEPVEEAGGFR